MPERVQPYDEAAEKGLLGCVLYAGVEILDELVAIGVTEDDFYVPAHRLIWGAMKDVAGRGKAVDLLTVLSRLKDAGNLERVGGELMVERMIDAPTPTYYLHYADLVQQKGDRRRIITAAQEAAIAAYDDNEQTSEEIRSKAEFALGDLRRVKADRRTPSEILDVQMQAWVKAQEKGMAGISTGMKLLDKFFGGLLPGGVYFFSGMAKSCKTTLARNIVEHVSGTDGLQTAVASLEQTAEQFWGQIAASHARIQVYHLNNGGRVDFDRLAASKAVVKDWPIYVDDSRQTLETLWSFARFAVGKKKAKLLVIDYIQRIRADKKYKTDEERLTDYSGTITEMAKSLQVPIILISAENRGGTLRGSNMMEYDGMGHVSLKRAEDWNAANLTYELTFRAQRFGPAIDSETLRLDPDTQRLHWDLGIGGPPSAGARESARPRDTQADLLLGGEDEAEDES